MLFGFLSLNKNAVPPKRNCTSYPTRNGLQRFLARTFDFGLCAHRALFGRCFGGWLCRFNLRPPRFLSRCNPGASGGTHFTFLLCIGRCRCRSTKNRNQFLV